MQSPQLHPGLWGYWRPHHRGVEEATKGEGGGAPFSFEQTLPDSDSGKKPKFRFWLANPEDYPDTFVDEFQIEAPTDGRRKLITTDERPKAPRIQALLKLAYELQVRLQQDQKLTRSALARELGITPTRITQIMNLLRLAPSVQKQILELPAVGTRDALSEKHLRTLCRIPDPKVQAEVFGHLQHRQRHFEAAKEAVSTLPESRLAASTEPPKDPAEA